MRCASTSIDCSPVWISAVILSGAFSAILIWPALDRLIVSRLPVITSELLRSARAKPRIAGWREGRPEPVCTVSAWPASSTTWFASYSTPQALSSFGRSEAFDANIAADGFSGSCASWSCSAFGSRNSSTRPPRSTNWSMA